MSLMAYVNNLTTPLVIKVSTPSQEGERSGICMLEVSTFLMFLRLFDCQSLNMIPETLRALYI
jgi:hypothetical protein